VNSRQIPFTAAPRGCDTPKGTPYPEVTGLICRVPSRAFSRAPENIHLAYLCRFRVRTPHSSGTGFSWHSAGGLRDHICPRPCGTAMSDRPLAPLECVRVLSTSCGGAGILTCRPSTTPLG